MVFDAISSYLSEMADCQSKHPKIECNYAIRKNKRVDSANSFYNNQFAKSTNVLKKHFAVQQMQNLQ